MRKYHRDLGARSYQNYTEERLNNAVKVILDKKISIRNAAQRFNIPKNTPFNKSQELRGLKKPAASPGGQKVFSTEEESRFVAHAIAMSSYGFPITCFDLRCLVKSYLSKTGRKVPCFKNGNFPGREWAFSFMARHKDVLSQRLSKNISYARAANNEEVIDTFFLHLENELKDMPPENIWNYDETNVQDDPGSKEVLTRRGAKYPEQIQNSSKACTSLMVCGNAAGETLPLYVNYKAEKMWSTWTEDGPEGTRYNRTKSGWFDHNVFEDWFFTLALPRLKKQPGEKALIGDNLSSHISLDVLNACEENGIKFIALPPNATHLLQPLDVAYFRPMKVQWRTVLGDWKKKTSGSKTTSVPKEEFPGLLKTMMAAMAADAPQNLKSGFRKTGIYPLNKMEVLRRLPEAVLSSSLGPMTECVGDIFLEELRKRRDEVTQLRGRKRRKMLNVAPGKSITSADVEASSSLASTAKEATASTGRKGTQKKPPPKKKTRRVEETDDSDISFQVSGENLGEDGSESSDDSSSSPSSGSQSDEEGCLEQEPKFKVGDYVVISFQKQQYPGKVTVVRPGGYMVSAMERSGKHWRWPARKDEIMYSDREVLYQIDPPKNSGIRGLFKVKEIVATK